MNKKIKRPNILLNTNIIFSILILIVNIPIFYLLYLNKNLFFFLVILLNFIIFITYRLRISSLIKTYLMEIKKEIFNINYPLYIGLILFLFIIILIMNIIGISVINKDALNPTFIFSYYIKTLSDCLPAIFLYTYIFLINPIFVLPKVEQKKKYNLTNLIIIVLFILFIIFSFSKLVSNELTNNNYENKYKIRAIKIPVTYTFKFLQYKGLTEERIHILKKSKFETPFYFTSEGFKFNKYEDAEKFCKSLNAKVASHKEIYNIIFNNFDLLGDEYYWTSDKAGINHLLLHFKNMTYEVLTAPANVSPIAYCTIPASQNNILQNSRFFIRLEPEKTKNNSQKLNIKNFLSDIKNNENKLNNKNGLNSENSLNSENELNSKNKLNSENKQDDYQKLENSNNLNSKEEISHVNFSIKHVPKSVLNNLINKGYYYNSEIKANGYYESDKTNFINKTAVNANDNNIRLCYYPFTEYKNISLNNQKEIWRQSFCRPSFKLINITPQLKSRYDKDAYCYANGGRLPNIPELTAIIEIKGINAEGQRYWTNTKITDLTTQEQIPISVYFTNNEFLTAEANTTEEKINTFCITQSDKPSNIISNYKSMFSNEDGKDYAEKICPSCKYYEMPDTVLIQ